MTNEYYRAKARCRAEERMARYRFWHRLKIRARRVYAWICLIGIGFVGLVAIWEMGKVIEWTVRFIAGLIGLI